MNILIIEDHPLISSGIKHLIYKIDPRATVSHTDNFPSGLLLLASKKFDLAILDIDIPGGENIRMMEMIREKQQEIKILVHSGYDETVYALPYMQAGADGFLSKQAPEEDFHMAFHALLNRGKYVSYSVQQNLLVNLGESSTRKSKNPLTTLSPREMLVMQLLIEGKWTKEIAATLDLKENTISTYKRRIYDKLDVSDEIQLSRKVSLLRSH